MLYACFKCDNVVEFRGNPKDPRCHCGEPLDRFEDESGGTAAHANERVLEVLFAAGPQWGDRSPKEIIDALAVAGFVIVPRTMLVKLAMELT